uniref:Uncharacterized protein n=1 Tax=Cacopsylla melanoneura TaxID=428564 RepID=A0A8D8SE66_9HEMI
MNFTLACRSSVKCQTHEAISKSREHCDILFYVKPTFEQLRTYYTAVISHKSHQEKHTYIQNMSSILLASIYTVSIGYSLSITYNSMNTIIFPPLFFFVPFFACIFVFKHPVTYFVCGPILRETNYTKLLSNTRYLKIKNNRK